MDTSSLKKYLLPIIALLAVIVLLPLVVMPGITDIQTDYQQNQTEQQLKDQLAAKVSQLSQLDNSQALQKLNQYVEPAIPSDPDPAGLLGTIEQTALLSGDQTKSSTFAATSSKPADSGDISATVVLAGDYPSIANFIAQTEKTARLLQINTLKLTGSQGGQSQVTATFEISSPYENLTSLGQPESPLPADLTGKPIYTKLQGLNRASYAPLDTSAITGKQNPF